MNQMILCPLMKSQEKEYDPEAVDEINNDNAEPFEDTMDDLSVASPEPEEEDLR